jgi:hypothetical protein
MKALDSQLLTPVCTNLIVVGDGGEIGKLVLVGAERCLPHRAFVDLAVSHHHDDAAVEFLDAGGERHADTHRQAVAESAGGGFDARNLRGFRMAAEDGIAAAEGVERLDPKEALVGQHDVLRDTAMTLVAEHVDLVVVRHHAPLEIGHRGGPRNFSLQRLAGKQIRIVVGERSLDLECLLQILRQLFGVAFGHAVQVALGMIVLGHRDFHLGLERQVVEVGGGSEGVAAVEAADAVVLDVEEADAAAGLRDLVGHRAAADGAAGPERLKVDHRDVGESELAAVGSMGVSWQADGPVGVRSAAV